MLQPVALQAPDTASAHLTLPQTLGERLEQLALQRGCGFEALGLELLQQALEQAETLPAGRCSTRMGHCSAGPVPLPVQQEQV
jgi:hypothetical protein